MKSSVFAVTVMLQEGLFVGHFRENFECCVVLNGLFPSGGPMHIVLLFVGLFFLPDAHLLSRVVKRILL